jgi:hypothetical protein
VSASSTIHDPIFGGSFTIGYLLPDRSSISFSEAPLRSQATAFQCSVSLTAAGAGSRAPTVVPSTNAVVQICSGVRGTTSIVFSARGTVASLRRFLQALRPGVNWIPAS